MRQKALSGLIEKEASLRLFNAATSERDKARLNCVSREGSGDWLTALPSKALGAPPDVSVHSCCEVLSWVTNLPARGQLPHE